MLAISALALTGCLLCARTSTYGVVRQSTIQQRIDQYKGNDTVRASTLVHLFTESGCPAAQLTQQQVPDRHEPNVLCVLPGTTAETIVVGAHFDHVDAGDGIIDNWSGASLLPSLLQSLSTAKHRHTFIFVGFTGEEAGLVGSAFYVKHLSPEEVSTIEAMINLDTLGLGPTKVWIGQSDPRLVSGLTYLSRTMDLPLEGMNLDGYGLSDEESFIRDRICTLTIHSITAETMHVLHRPADNPSALRIDDYYATYRLLAAYLNILDNELTADGHLCTAKPIDPASLRRMRPRLNRLPLR